MVEEKDRRWSDLTEKEQKVLVLFVEGGMPLKQVAGELGISLTYVKALLLSAYHILGVESGRGAAFWMGRHFQEIRRSRNGGRVGKQP